MSFQVGREAVALRDDGPFVRKGNIYEITCMDRCCRLWIGVGVAAGSDADYEAEYCPYCFTQCADSHNEVMYEAAFFRPVEPLRADMDRIEREGVQELQHELLIHTS